MRFCGIVVRLGWRVVGVFGIGKVRERFTSRRGNITEFSVQFNVITGRGTVRKRTVKGGVDFIFHNKFVGKIVGRRAESYLGIIHEKGGFGYVIDEFDIRFSAKSVNRGAAGSFGKVLRRIIILRFARDFDEIRFGQNKKPGIFVRFFIEVDIRLRDACV